MPRSSKPTSIRLAPKMRQALLQVAESRRWTLTQTINIACEELIGRYLFGKKVRRRKVSDAPIKPAPEFNDPPGWKPNQ